MLHPISDLKGYSISASDGEIGQVEDFLFDDQHWVVRYIVIDTGRWLPGRKVLISPISIGRADRENQVIEVKLRKEQIENSPSIETDKPVSRQHETTFANYYGYPYYWGGPYLWGPAAYPSALGAPPYSESAAEREQARAERAQESNDPHLRIARAVNGYYIEANDGDIGHVEDFLVDDQDWAIRYMLVDTKNWWPGKKVLVSPNWIERLSWSDSRVYVNESRDNIKHAPEYNSAANLERDYENDLHRHYNRNPYWD